MKRLLFASFLLMGFLATVQVAGAQTLTYARTFDASGNMVGRDSIFDYHPPHLTIAVKLKNRTNLATEELYVIVKDVNGTVGRFLMKRSNRNAMEANALVRLTKEGIYRIYVYDPAQRNRPLAYGRVFITGQLCPSREALIVAQRNTLIQRGVVQGTVQPVPTQRTGQLATTQPTTRPATTTTTQQTTQATTRPATTATTQQTAQATTRPATTANTQQTTQTATRPATTATTQQTAQATTRPATTTTQQGAGSQSASAAGDDFSADIDDLDFDDSDDADLGTFSEQDFGSLDHDLNAMDTELHEANTTSSDFGGDFESFDEMDDEFDFQINDF